MTNAPLPRLAILFDAVEEGWPSMDLVSEMLLKALTAGHHDRVTVTGVHPRFCVFFNRAPIVSDQVRFTLNRLATRFLSHPTQLLSQRKKFDLFHIADHSSAQLAHVLPAERTGIFCHDIDAFASLFSAGLGTSTLRRLIARTQLSGLQRAAVVFHSTNAVRKQLVENHLVDPAKLVHAPYGIASEFSDPPPADLVPLPLPEGRFLLHVGSGMLRKRLDVLFRVYAAIRTEFRDLFLVQQGAVLTRAHRDLARELGITDRLVQPPFLTRIQLTDLYRRSSLVLVPSESEGFGLPIVEALAAGATVLASDLPVLREVGGAAVVYRPVGDVESWAEATRQLLRNPEQAPARAIREDRARTFSWERHARIIADAYIRLI